ncbi:TonB-dependent receptor [Sphingomonas metalli]|uniref:TonB-dependent receptor n=1 Tax=Sphingomonas metalli TaxID=1779358 RepID=A0A916WP77_9SPHN|nr:TonB-dependent receptor [Sphingomonas metalli]GGB19476.1 TonB-dependent receptor [Sphingomonas metalli]
MMVSLVAMCVALPAPVLAQEPPAAPAATAQTEVDAEQEGLADIVVTAQRRTENLQRVAVPVTAVTGDALVNAGVTETANLSKLVPSLVVQPTGGTTSFFLRGVGTASQNSFSENAIAFNFNGVYIGRPTAPAGVFYDLERVEVVKGPQGTLYGRNATGGAINVLPRRPQLGTFSAEGLVEYGNYDSKKAFGAINVPIGDTVALRLAGQVIDRDGYQTDGYEDERGEAVRASLLLRPASDWSMILVGDYYRQHGNGGGAVLLSSAAFTAPPLKDRIGLGDPRAIAIISNYAATVFAPPFCGGFGGFVRSGCVSVAANDGYVDNHFYGVSAQVDGDLGFAKLTVLPAYRKSKVDLQSYVPGFLGKLQEDTDQMSLEVRLTSNDAGRLRYVLGAFFFNEEQDATNFFRQGTISTTRFTPQVETQSLAAFGQLSFSLTERLRLIGGGRYTKEDKSQRTAAASGGLPGPVEPSLGTPFTGALTFEKFTWKAGVEFDAAPASLLYANVATGFKSGGFFVAAPPNNTYAPEELTAYTAGTKNRFFDNKLQVNLEAFYWKYSNQQITFVGGVRTGNGVFAQGSVTTNAGRSHMYGAELDLRFAPSRSDQFFANVQYLRGKYDSLLTANFSPTGAPVPTGCAVVGTRVANPGINGAVFFDIDCSGKPTANSPKWAANIGYERTVELGGDLSLLLGARTNLETSRFLNTNYRPEETQGGFMMSDLYATLRGPGSRWSLTGFVNNVENRAVIARAGTRPILNFPVGTLRPPRTYGVRAGFSF